MQARQRRFPVQRLGSTLDGLNFELQNAGRASDGGEKGKRVDRGWATRYRVNDSSDGRTQDHRALVKDGVPRHRIVEVLRRNQLRKERARCRSIEGAHDAQAKKYEVNGIRRAEAAQGEK